MSMFSFVPWKMIMKAGPAAARFLQSAWQVAVAADVEACLPALAARLDVVEMEARRLQKCFRTMIIFIVIATVLSLAALIVGIVALIR